MKPKEEEKTVKMCKIFPSSIKGGLMYTSGSYNEIVQLANTKVVSNFAVRWHPPFAPILHLKILQFLPRLRRRVQVYCSRTIFKTLSIKRTCNCSFIEKILKSIIHFNKYKRRRKIIQSNPPPLTP